MDKAGEELIRRHAENGRLTPSQMIRLLRAKEAELERKVLSYHENGNLDKAWECADVSLLYSLLAAHLEDTVR